MNLGGAYGGRRAHKAGMAIAREVDTMTVRRPLTEKSILGSAGATPAAAIGIGAVRVYQWTLRPFIGSHCRFWPSCSEYAVDALRAHGAVRGTGLAVKRILRCNPWHEGGVDPVPGIDRNTGH